MGFRRDPSPRGTNCRVHRGYARLQTPPSASRCGVSLLEDVVAVVTRRQRGPADESPAVEWCTYRLACLWLGSTIAMSFAAATRSSQPGISCVSSSPRSATGERSMASPESSAIDPLLGDTSCASWRSSYAIAPSRRSRKQASPTTSAPASVELGAPSRMNSLRRSGWRRQAEAAAARRAVLVERRFAPARPDQHVQVGELRLWSLVRRPDQPLDHEHAAAAGVDRSGIASPCSSSQSCRIHFRTYASALPGTGRRSCRLRSRSPLPARGRTRRAPGRRGSRAVMVSARSVVRNEPLLLPTSTIDRKRPKSYASSSARVRSRVFAAMYR